MKQIFALLLCMFSVLPIFGATDQKLSDLTESLAPPTNALLYLVVTNSDRNVTLWNVVAGFSNKIDTMIIGRVNTASNVLELSKQPGNANLTNWAELGTNVLTGLGAGEYGALGTNMTNYALSIGQANTNFTNTKMPATNATAYGNLTVQSNLTVSGAISIANLFASTLTLTNGTVYPTNGMSYVAGSNLVFNGYAGRVRLVSGVPDFWLTNSYVTTNTAVTATVNTADGTIVSVRAIPGTGVLNLKCNGNAAASTDISWVILIP